MDLDFSRPLILIFIGKQASGKSFLLRNLIYQLTKQNTFKFGHVFSATSFNPDYDFMPEKHVDGDYSEHKLELYIDSLKKWMTNNPGKKLPPSFLILDDLLGKIHQNSDVFSNLMSTYRHFNMTVFITSQYMVRSISTLLRELADVAFIFKSKFKNTRTSLYEAFGQSLESQDEFDDVLERATKERRACLVYKANEDKIEDAYLSFKCPGDDHKFKLKF